MGKRVCRSCRSGERVTRRVDLLVHWPGGGVRLAELELCGACCAALLDMIDTGQIQTGIQVELPGLGVFDSTRKPQVDDPSHPTAKQRRKR